MGKDCSRGNKLLVQKRFSQFPRNGHLYKTDTSVRRTPGVGPVTVVSQRPFTRQRKLRTVDRFSSKVVESELIFFDGSVPNFFISCKWPFSCLL